MEWEDDQNGGMATIPAEMKTALGCLKVQARQCSTCIYRSDTHFDLAELEAEVQDNRVGFKSYRVCHHSEDACCQGFWNRHKDQFPAGQIAQRLGIVEYVDDDTLAAGGDSDV